MGIEEYSYVSHRNCGKMQFCEFPDEFYWFSQNSSHSSPHVTVNSQFQTIHHAENVQNHLCRTYSPHNKAMKRSTKRWNVQTSTIPMEVIFCVPNVSKFHFASKHTHTATEISPPLEIPRCSCWASISGVLFICVVVVVAVAAFIQTPVRRTSSCWAWNAFPNKTDFYLFVRSGTRVSVCVCLWIVSDFVLSVYLWWSFDFCCCCIVCIAMTDWKNLNCHTVNVYS